MMKKALVAIILTVTPALAFAGGPVSHLPVKVQLHQEARAAHRLIHALKHGVPVSKITPKVQRLDFALQNTAAQMHVEADFTHSLPTLVTAPMHTSVIMLQPGSHPVLATGAPASGWSVHAIMVGNQPEVIVRPKVEGLHTDLVIPATSASGKPMNYVIELTSDQHHYTPLMSALMKKPDRATLLKTLEQDAQWASGQEKRLQ